MKATLEWLTQPEVFQVNREPAHSDHKFYVKGESTRRSLNGTWKFCYSENPSLRPVDFYRRDYDLSSFEEIQVPGHIQLQGYDRCQYVNTMYPWDGVEDMRPPQVSETYNPVGSYATEFTAVKKEGERTYLLFEGVETAFYVWLNGEFVGYGEDSFTPSEFDITQMVTDGKNRLAVEVYKRSSASWIEDQDFWRFSGIFRDVSVYTTPKLHVKDLKIKGKLKHDYRDGRLEAELTLQGETGGRVVAYLSDASRNIVWKSEQEASALVSFAGEIPDVCPWSAELPNLYTLYLEVYEQEGEMTETVTSKVGFRTFEMKDGVMCLNGKRVLFKGINRHEFNARRGRSITQEDMLWDIRFMKRHNINAVRTCHYPNQSRWYELCDEYGIYLIDEMNLESHGSWQKMGACDPSWNVPGSLRQWRECVLDRAAAMLERDKNHPSILIWSCGNESYAGDVLQEVSDYFHRQDETRLVHYEGVFWNREYDAISDMESRMYAKPEEIREYLEGNPKKPYISCEYMHAMGNSLGGMELYTQLEDAYPGYQGGFIWDYIDQALYRSGEDGEEILSYGGDFDDRATDYCFCTNGVVYADRRISPKAQEVKALYTDVRITVDQGLVTVENRSLFRDTEGYRFRFMLEREGVLLEQREQALKVAPGENVRLRFPIELPGQEGEYSRLVTMVLAEDTLWASKGYEMSWGQEVCAVARLQRPVKHTGDVKAVCGDVNIGVGTAAGFALFSKAEGGLVSLVYKGREYITRTPKLTYWRASTDNDRGMHAEHTGSQWLAAGMGQIHLGDRFRMEEHPDRVKLTFVYRSGSVPPFETAVEYTVSADGAIDVSVTYPGVENMTYLPAFGLEFKLKKELDQLRWYGRGPEETYWDRMTGARIGIFESTAKDSMSAYLIPQECGNRTDVRWLEVTGQDGRGLRFGMRDRPIQCSALPYSAMELENALHSYELPQVNYTWVRILAGQTGVGGDDSWGAPIHEQYRLSSRRPITLNFTISPC